MADWKEKIVKAIKAKGFDFIDDFQTDRENLVGVFFNRDLTEFEMKQVRNAVPLWCWVMYRLSSQYIYANPYQKERALMVWRRNV